MYKIEKKDFGYYLTFEGSILRHEMESWYADAVRTLEIPQKSFGVLADLRKMKVLPKESQSKLEEGQKYFKRRGMIRSVVILKDTLTTVQFTRIAINSGIYKYERYIDASVHDEWEAIAIKWLVEEVDPDKK